MKCATLKTQNRQIRKKIVNFSSDTKILDGTSNQNLLFAKIILGFFKTKNYVKIDKIEDIIEITQNIDILEFCIQESYNLINNLLEKEIFKTFINEYLTMENNNLSDSIQLSSGKFYSKILYPDGKINYITHKFPLYYDNEIDNIEIDWNHKYFDIRTNKYKNNDKVPIILKGSRDIRNTIGVKYLPEIEKFIKLLKETIDFILGSIENEFN